MGLCQICGRGHHYYRCPDDGTNDNGDIKITNEDIKNLLDVISIVIKDNNDIKYKKLHKKILDIAIM